MAGDWRREGGYLHFGRNMGGGTCAKRDARDYLMHSIDSQMKNQKPREIMVLGQYCKTSQMVTHFSFPTLVIVSWNIFCLHSRLLPNVEGTVATNCLPNYQEVVEHLQFPNSSRLPAELRWKF